VKVGAVKYIEGSKLAHDQRAISRKAEVIEPVLAALTDKRLDVSRETYFVVVINDDTQRAVIVDVEDEYEDAYREAQLCFSAMHEIGMPFRWSIRIDRSYLRAT
jgi:hypothetical protein